MDKTASLIILAILGIATAIGVVAAPMYQFNEAVGWIFSILGSSDQLSFIGWIQFAGDLGEEFSTLSLAGYVAVAGAAILVIGAVLGVAGKGAKAVFAIGNLATIAGVGIHNAYLISKSTIDLYGTSIQLGAPTVWSWVILGVCALGLLFSLIRSR